MASPSPRSALDHLVVVMFENRSFDHLFGRLYSASENPRFEGTDGRSLSNPIPSDVPGHERGPVTPHPADGPTVPDPDPGEEHPHTNTQLFGGVSPASNRFGRVDDLVAPFNAPADPTAEPTMVGFVEDYINTFRVERGRLPRYEEYAQIMAGYTPAQLPVFSTLARGFACFDHWFCEVPSQTYPNRSFVHAGTSSGFVLNGPPGKFASRNDAPTIFERLENAHVSWKVYIDPAQILPATALIHARRLAPFFATHFSTIFDFFDDARDGNLPAYSFLEPNLLFPHADMHPPGADRLRRALGFRGPNRLARAEQYLAEVYGALRSSSARSGSNWSNTAMIVTFDEHGGIYDHVPPPRVNPPSSSAPPGEEGFRFDRSGVRVPAFLVSAWVDPATVVSSEFRHSSVIRTLRERWNLGGPLTNRDRDASDLAPLFVRSEPRSPSEWPSVEPRPLGAWDRILEGLGWTLSHLENDLVREALAHESSATEDRPPEMPRGFGRWTARRHLKRIAARDFPGLAAGRRR